MAASTRAAFSLVALGTALCLTGAGSGVAASSSDTLDLQASFSTRYVLEACPPGTQPDAQCRRYSGAIPVPGLGDVTASYVKVVGDESVCPADAPILQPRSAVLAVAGKGAIQISVPGPICLASGPAHIGPLNTTITGGSGSYGGASGALVFESDVSTIGTTRDEWRGNVRVAGFDFDLTPPVVSGARSKTVRAPRHAKRVRVRYAVTARDAVDGVVPAGCIPRSGSRFKLGRTGVSCVATDSSANSVTKRFAITVKKSRR